MSRSLSVIVPAYNERENIEILYNETYEVLSKIKRSKIISDFEIIIVNDGSTDGTDEIIKKLCKRKGSKLVGISLRKNFGQTAALKAGIDAARGDLIVTMDADLQNDPADIPRLIGKLKEGYDVVSGWRAKRKDPLGKRMASKIINLLRKKMIGDEPHDYGGSLKIYERECLKDLELFGELHRYVTGYLFIKGYKIGEIKVNHRPRKFGKTNPNSISNIVQKRFIVGPAPDSYAYLASLLPISNKELELISLQDYNAWKNHELTIFEKSFAPSPKYSRAEKNRD